MVIGFARAVPADHSLWIGDLSNGTAQQAQLSPMVDAFPAPVQRYPYQRIAAYAVTTPLTLRAGHDIVAYLIAPQGDNCAPALAGRFGSGG